MRDALCGERRTTRGIDEAACLAGAHELLVEDGDILEQRKQIDLLLVMHAKEVMIGLAGDGEHGCAVELRVVQPVEQMNRAGSRRRQTHSESASELCVAARHECSRLLVPDLDEADLLLPRA